MKYNDFQILSDSEYLTINQHYLETTNDGEVSFLTKTCQELQSSLNFNWTSKINLNKKTLNKIKETCSILEKTLNSLTAQFNIKLLSNKTINNFNLFSFVKHINQTLYFLTKWFENEEKEYCKKIAKTCIFELLEAQKNIFIALENSEIILFKYM